MALTISAYLVFAHALFPHAYQVYDAFHIQIDQKLRAALQLSVFHTCVHARIKV